MNPGLILMWAYDCCRMNFMKAKNITKCIVSEVDTQRPKIPRECGEFVSTWSPNGFNEEVHCPVEGYSEGTYFSDKNRTGYQTVSSSLRPNGEPFLGFTIRHAEAITLHKLFPNATCMYIYKCPDEAVSSLFEYQDLRKLKKERIIYSKDILDGVDELGVLLTDGKKCIWYGSYLSNDDIKELYLGQYINSTSYQVTCGLYMGIQYLFELRKKEHYRLVTPEEVATDYTNFQEDLDRVNLDLKINVLELDASNENVQNFMKNVKFEDQFVENQNKHKNHLAKHHEQQDKIHIELSPDGQEINGLTENNENVIEEKLEKKTKEKTSSS